MSIIVTLIVVFLIFGGWWLWRHHIADKPWATQGPVVLRNDMGQSLFPAPIALTIFLAVVTSFFALFISAYFIRMGLPDWLPLQEPGLLWFNTAILVAGSIAIQFASIGISKNQVNTTKISLLATGVFTGSFIVGQLIAWQQLVDQGYYLQSNPANAFFYLITGLHALHMLGGLWVWYRTTVKVWSGTDLAKVQQSVQLCRTYWHYLLLIWVALFGVLLST